MALQGEKVDGGTKAKTAGYQRWWDPAWRAVRLSEAKNPQRQFSKEHLEMAELMGVSPEELAKSMSATTAVELDSTEYDQLLTNCVRAAQAGDILGLVQAGEVFDKMEQVLPHDAPMTLPRSSHDAPSSRSPARSPPVPTRAGAPQVGLRPSVEAYNGVIAACAASAGGKFAPCPRNDTAAREPFVQRAVDLEAPRPHPPARPPARAPPLPLY